MQKRVDKHKNLWRCKFIIDHRLTIRKTKHGYQLIIDFKDGHLIPDLICTIHRFFEKYKEIAKWKYLFKT